VAVAIRPCRQLRRSVLPCMLMCYFAQALDKGCLGTASIMGLQADTGMVGQGRSRLPCTCLSQRSDYTHCQTTPLQTPCSGSASSLARSPPSRGASWCSSCRSCGVCLRSLPFVLCEKLLVGRRPCLTVQSWTLRVSVRSCPPCDLGHVVQAPRAAPRRIWVPDHDR
jgi:hypothetical protein